MRSSLRGESILASLFYFLQEDIGERSGKPGVRAGVGQSQGKTKPGGIQER